jgi:hypothetical protein
MQAGASQEKYGKHSQGVNHLCEFVGFLTKTSMRNRMLPCGNPQLRRITTVNNQPQINQ